MAQIIADFVIESSTTTGTGNISVSGALSGLRRFRDKCSVGDKLRYIIKSVDGNGVPTGQFEIVKGTYSALDTLTRDTVIDSSNAGALVNFGAGAKHVYMGLDAGVIAWVRERLFAARTYYVRADGNDNNDGLANTSGGAFATLQKAYDTALTLDTNGYAVTIKAADGTYTAGVAVTKPLVGGGALYVEGNTTTPANCVISLSSGSCFAVSNTAVNISGFKLANSAGYGIFCTSGGKAFPSSMEYGACSAHHNRASGSGSQIELTGAIAISGDAQTFIAADGSGANTQLYQSTVTFSGTRTFSTAFAWSSRNAGLRTFTMTWAGTHASTVGKKYDVIMNSTLELNSVTFPGGTAGTYATGGQVSAA